MRPFGPKLQPENLIGINDLLVDGWKDSNHLTRQHGDTNHTVLNPCGLCLMHCYLHCFLEVRATGGNRVGAVIHSLLNLVCVVVSFHYDVVGKDFLTQVPSGVNTNQP